MPEQTIREWLEETADRIVSDGFEAAGTLHPDVTALRWEPSHEWIEMVPNASIPGPPQATFIADLRNGNSIETVRTARGSA